MTWDEFKKLVDDELQKQGYDGSTVEVDVIDVGLPSSTDFEQAEFVLVENGRLLIY